MYLKKAIYVTKDLWQKESRSFAGATAAPIGAEPFQSVGTMLIGEQEPL